VTLATNDSYAVGALTLASSLKRIKTTKKIVIMVTNTVSDNMKNVLKEEFDDMVAVDAMDSCDISNLSLLDRPELGITFTKISCWTLTQYTKCVFLDADTLVLQNCDEIFEREELSASPDAGWPDCFNSGVFVFRPNMNTYQSIIQHAVTVGSFDGGDQGLLNSYFSDWATKDISRHLPFTYNMVSSAYYSYLPAFKQFGKQVKIVHFIGSMKPWLICFNNSGEPQIGGSQKGMEEHLKLWWQIFSDSVKPVLDKSSPSFQNKAIPCFSSSIGNNSSSVGKSSSSGSTAVDTRESWEAGRPDYTGTASFSNILKKIDKTLNS